MPPLASPPRGETELDLFVAAMRHELDDNSYKGHWLEDGVDDEARTAIAANMPGKARPRTDAELLGDLLYHAAKLASAVRVGDKAAILEYAADVGNCAWFVADAHTALSEPHHDGPIEYDLEHGGLGSVDRAALRVATHNLADDILGGDFDVSFTEVTE